VVGAGWIAGQHVCVLDEHPAAQLVAVSDLDRARAERLAGPRGARAYGEWEEMLEHERLDAVSVCTPPLVHRDPVLAALSAGIHVYLEKPIARTRPDAQAIVEAAARCDAICAVGYQWHASELLEVVREVTAGQALAMLIGRNYGPVVPRPWFLDREQGGGQLLERGSHHIDLQRALAGEIEWVQATSGAVVLAQAQSLAGNIEDVVELTLRFSSGALGSVSIAWTRDGHPEVYGVDVLAEDATLLLDLGPDRFRIRGFGSGHPVEAEHGDPFARSIAGFLEAVTRQDPAHVYCTPPDAYQTLRVTLACERALAEGGTVAVEL
jgi:myo-inositol 2-dehydrogenase / D-chiro-inositol 1-dehydrogenase